MNSLAESFSTALLQATLAMTLTGGLLWLLLKGLHVRSPRSQRTACLLVLLEGWVFAGWTVRWEWPLQGEAAHHGRIHRVSAEDFGDRIAEDRHNLAQPPLRAVQWDASRNGAAPGRIQRPTWAQCLVTVWAIGLVSYVATMLFRYLRFVRLLPRLSLPSDDELQSSMWNAEWRALLNEQGIAGIPMMMTRDLGPALCRLPGGYRLLIPAELWLTLTRPQRDAVLRHELAHYVRGDVWKSVAVRLLAAPHWFNPIAWLALRRYDECAEWACDEQVRKSAPHHVCDLARVLLHLGSPGASPLVLSSHVSGRGLSGRIRRLVAREPQEDSGMKRLVVITAMVVACVVGVLRVQAPADESVAEQTATKPTAQGTVGDSGARKELPDGAPREEVVEELVEGPAGSAPGRDAVVDVARVFRADAGFEKSRQQLIKRVEADRALSRHEAEQLRELAERLKALQEADGVALEDIQEHEIRFATTRAKFDARRRVVQQQVIRLESEMYDEAYDRILHEVRQYAQEQGFRTVRRQSLRPRTPADQAGQAAHTAVKLPVARRHAADLVHGTPISVAQAEAFPGTSYHDGQVGRRVLLSRINQDVLYTAGDVKVVDITDVIIERLNAESSSADEIDSES